MPIPPDIVKCYKYIDLHAKKFIDELKEIVKIRNVSKDRLEPQHLKTAVYWMIRRLKSMGFNVTLKTPNYETYKAYKFELTRCSIVLKRKTEGSCVKSTTFQGNKPPALVAYLGNDPEKVTMLYYCHLDVLKVEKEDWRSEPFTVTEKDGRLYGRGTAKMKGPLLCFLHALDAYRELGIDLPINIKLICESMHECNSRGLDSVLEEVKPTFLQSVDCIMMTESHWLGKQYPCIVYGMRGVIYFNLKAEGPTKDLNSGDFGGIVYEPMKDIVYILSSLIDPYGKIQIPGFYDDVVEVTPDEEDFYKKIKCDLKEYKSYMHVDKLGHNGNMKMILMHVWRYPWLNMHYINGTCDDGNLLNIPRKVVARFSIRMVPNQRSFRISQLIIDFVNDLINKRKSPNKIEINSEFPLDPWYENHLHWNYEAANIATKQVYKEEANFIREGNGLPTLLKLRDAMPKRNILILPIVDCESYAHQTEESISLRCYIEGTKLLVSYFHALAEAARRHRAAKRPLRHHSVCRQFLRD